MFEESLSEYLETVTEYIFDNDKLVSILLNFSISHNTTFKCTLY